MKTYLKRFLALALILVIALIAVSCNKNETPQEDKGTISIKIDDVLSIALDGEFDSNIAQNSELNLENKNLKVYLAENSEYLAYLLGDNAPSDVELLSDDDGFYVSLPITSNMIQGFSSEELGEELVFDITYLGNIISVTYNVIDVNVRSISYDFNGGKAESVSYIDEDGKKVTIKKEVLSYDINEGLKCLIGATREHYLFDGWYADDTKFESIEAGFNQNLHLVAKWIPIEYVITFETEYGIMKDVKFTAEAKENILLESPKTDDNESNGLVFIGWFTDKNYTQKVESHSKNDCKDTTYYAKWANVAVVSLEGEYSARIRSGKEIDWSNAYLKVVISKGEGEETRTVKLTDRNVSLPVTSQEVGIHEDVIVYTLDSVNYEIKISYETMNEDTFFINYVLNGGEFEEPSVDTYYDSNIGLSELPTPKKRAYDFLGWYTSNRFVGDPITSVEAGKRSDLTLYAKYDAHVYSISYYIGADGLEYAQEESVADQQFKNSETLFTNGEGKALIDGITLDGYHFIAWHTAYPFTEDNAVIYIPEDSCENLNLYAELGKKVESVAITSKNQFDKSEGSFKLVAEVTPADAYYKEATFEIISNKDSTGAVINGDILTAEYPGEIIIVAKADKGDSTIISEPFTLKITDRKAPVEQISIIPTENGRYIVKANDMINLKIKTVPEEIDMEDKVLTFSIYNDEIDSTPNQTLQSSHITIDNNEKTLSITKSGVYGSFTLKAVLSCQKNVDGILQDYSVETEATFIIPKTITNIEDLQNISYDGVYVLTQDIDLAGNYWNPLFAYGGDSLSFDNAFSGYIDGNGHLLMNLCIDTGLIDGLTAGLFGTVNNAVIKNIGFENATVMTESELSRVNYVGILSGAIKNSTIESVSVEGELEVKGIDYVGGVVGYMYGDMEKIKVGSGSELKITATITSSTNPTHVGGIAASFDGSLSDFSSSVNLTVKNVVTGGDIYVGAISGRSLGQLYNIGEINASVIVEEEGVADSKKPELLNYYSANSVYVGLIGKSNSIFKGKEDAPLKTTLSLTIDAYSTVYAGILGETDKEVEYIDFTANITVKKAKNLYVGGITGSTIDNISNVNGKVSIEIIDSDAIVLGGIAGNAYVVNNSIVTFNGTIISDSTKGTTSIGGIASNIDSVDGVIVEIGTLSINVANDIAFGGIASVAYGQIKGNVQISSLAVAASGGNIGGLAGQSQGIGNGSEVDITANISVSKNLYYGTVAAKHQGNAENVKACGNVEINVSTANNVYAGAYGELTDAIISGASSSYNQTIKVTSNKTDSQSGGATIYAGGISGKASAKKQGYIEDITANFVTFVVESLGKDKGTVVLGGVIGDNSVSITNTVSEGSIKVGALLKAYVGGFVGENTANLQGISKISLIEISYAFTKDRKVGGFVGTNESKGCIQTSYSETSLKGSSDGSDKTAYVGGFVGENDGTINACFVGGIDKTGNRVSSVVKIIENNNNGATDYLGGFVGYNNGGNISNAYTDASLDSNTTTGGFVGLSVYDSKKGSGRISYAIVLGELIGSSNTMGGFVYSAKLEDDDLPEGNFVECLFVSDKLKNALASSQLSFEEIVGMNSSIIVREDNYKNFDDDVWDIQANTLPVLKGFIE